MLHHPDRSLRLAGASNFRDLGGYPSALGGVVRWRRLFRSDHLAALTPDDVQAVRNLGVSRALDFRGASERAAVPYSVPGVAQFELPIEPTVVQRMKALMEAGQTLSPELTMELMRDTYRAFVNHNSDRFAALFQHLLGDDAPLVFHCTAGKDRTGFAAALILLALDVPRDVVMQDYLLTNELYRVPSDLKGRASPDVLKVLWRVQADFLEAALDTVEHDHGGVDQYLEQALGVGAAERRRLQTVYLQAS